MNRVTVKDEIISTPLWLLKDISRYIEINKKDINNSEILYKYIQKLLSDDEFLNEGEKKVIFVFIQDKVKENIGNNLQLFIEGLLQKNNQNVNSISNTMCMSDELEEAIRIGVLNHIGIKYLENF